MNVYVFPGRFQPFHNDHLRVVREVIATCEGLLLLGLIVHSYSDGEPTDEFEAEARRQHSPHRNPFSPIERLEMIGECMDAELGTTRSRVFPILLPRPEAHWPLVSRMIPGRRTWIVPDAGETFDGMKAHFFHTKGDAVLRIRLEPSTSGRKLREEIERGAVAWETDVPDAIRKHICRILGGRRTE